MLLLTSDMKMAEVIHYNYLLVPVIGRFGIRLGFGEKTVGQLCNERHIDNDFFLAIINTFSNPEYFPKKRLQKFDILQYIDYLKNTHDYFQKIQVPTVEKHINMLTVRAEGNKNLQLIQKFFLDYKNDLLEHIQIEEIQIFPYLRNINQLSKSTFDRQKFEDLTKNQPLNNFIDKHQNLDNKLFDLQNIIIKYLNGNFSEELTHAVIVELFHLKNEIKNHTKLEEQIVIPMGIEIEESLKVNLQ